MQKLSAALLLFLGLACAALAQSFTMPPPAGVLVNGCVFTTSPPTLTTGQTGFVQCDSLGRFILAPGAAGAAGFPSGAVPLTATATGSTGAISATLTAVAAKTTYICGFNYQGSTATAAVSANIAVSGTISGTMNFGYAADAAGVATPQPPPVIQSFTPCVPASAVNTSVVVTPPTLGAGATIATVSVWGYNL